MRIVLIVPGSGGQFYCENCVRDLSLAAALKRQGHDVVVVPMYLPIDDAAISGSPAPVFFGAVNTYLAQRVPLYRWTPRWFKSMFDSPRLLDWAARRSGSTRASDLSDMTVSMLRGEEGLQADSLDQLIRWLRAGPRPDVIHLSNLLLLGLARRLHRELAAPIVCSLQDEDAWIDAMDARYAKAVWDLAAQKSENVSAFVAVSQYYGEVIQKRTGIEAKRIHVVYPGVPVDGFNQAPLYFRPPVVGFLGRLSDSMGLGVLVEAYVRLKENSWLKGMRLRAAGGYTEDDVEFLQGIRDRLEALRHLGDVDFMPGFDAKSRIDFLQGTCVFSVPTPGGMAFGLPVLEAMASGVPVVQPAVGSFTEIVEMTGGGLLYNPGEMDEYLDAMGSVLLDPEKARDIGRRGRAHVLANLTVEHTAAAMTKVYEKARARF